jgi:hypothetical protein
VGARRTESTQMPENTADTTAGGIAETSFDDTPAVVMDEPVADRPAPAPPVASPVAQKRTGWGGPVLGGLIAAGLGFGLAQYLPFSGMIGGGSGFSTEEGAVLKAEIADLRAALAAVPPADTGAVAARLDAVEQALAGMAAPDLSAIEGRIATLEARPTGSLSGADAAALAALRAEVASMKSGGIAQSQVDAASAALQAKLDETLAAAEALRVDASETAAKAAQRGALLQIGAALDSGAAFGSALQALEGAEIPEALSGNAAGLPSLKTLQDGFPEAARLALDAALKADMGDGWGERAMSFLRTQVGARSLTARDGADPDAVLSRAEAALTAGDVGTALTELDALPEIARTAMAGWRAGADQRQAAQAALYALTQELGL